MMNMKNPMVVAMSVAVLAAVVFIVWWAMNKKGSKENFGGLPGFGTRVERHAFDGTDFRQVPVNFQAMLSPRMAGGVNFGTNIRYKFPSDKHMAVSSDPLAMSDMVSKEGYGCGGKMDDKKQDNVREEYPDVSDMLPRGTMTSINSMGEPTQHVLYDRIMHANIKSRKLIGSDFHRGDLPIPHCTNGEWFRPDVNPSTDLRTGAINVIAGINNETSNELAKFIALSSGGIDTTHGGVDMSDQLIKSGHAHSDVKITSFV